MAANCFLGSAGLVQRANIADQLGPNSALLFPSCVTLQRLASLSGLRTPHLCIRDKELITMSRTRTSFCHIENSVWVLIINMRYINTLGWWNMSEAYLLKDWWDLKSPGKGKGHPLRWQLWNMRTLGSLILLPQDIPPPALSSSSSIVLNDKDG